MQLDFITVVFDEEVSLLPWQAKSICRHVDPLMINKIVLVDNGSQQCSIDPAWYGKLFDKVEVITHKDLKLKAFQSLDGWRTQQLCKILASARSTVNWSVVLDAKTLFAKTFNEAELFIDARPCVGITPISKHWNDSKIFLEEFFNIKIEHVLGPGGVPFFFHNETIRTLIKSINEFNNWFQQNLYEQVPPHRTLVTEFMLYSAFLLKTYKSFDQLYKKEQKLISFNVADFEVEKFEQIFTAEAHTISVAEKTKKFLTNDQLVRWETFLNDKYN
jgi:hypothetical protein